MEVKLSGDQKNFIKFVVGYGLALNYAMTVLGFPFEWWTPLGWGFLFYFVREEAPGIIRKIIGGR